MGIAAAARYISSSKYKGKVMLTGLGTPNQMRKFVKDGTVQAFELWDPGKLGELAGYAAANLASGTITGKEGDAFEAGPLGKKTVGKDGAHPPVRTGVAVWQQGDHGEDVLARARLALDAAPAAAE